MKNGLWHSCSQILKAVICLWENRIYFSGCNDKMFISVIQSFIKAFQLIKICSFGKSFYLKMMFIVKYIIRNTFPHISSPVIWYIHHCAVLLFLFQKDLKCHRDKYDNRSIYIIIFVILIYWTYQKLEYFINITISMILVGFSACVRDLNEL